MPTPLERFPIEPPHFVAHLAANVDNEKLSDAGFRQMVRNTLPAVRGPHSPEKAEAPAPHPRTGARGR